MLIKMHYFNQINFNHIYVLLKLKFNTKVCFTLDKSYSNFDSNFFNQRETDFFNTNLIAIKLN